MSCTCIQGEMPAPIGHFMCFRNQKPIQVKALLVYERERDKKDQLHHLGFLLADACGSTHHTAFVDICPTPIYPPDIVPS